MGGGADSKAATLNLAGRIEASTDAVLKGKNDIEAVLGGTINNPTFSQIISQINNLNQENLDGRNSVGQAIMQKDDSVVVPTDPSFAQLVTGVSQIKSGAKIDFAYNSVPQFEELTTGSAVPITENPIIYHFRYNKVDKKIYYFRPANTSTPSIPLLIFDKTSNAWSSQTIVLTGSRMYTADNYVVEVDRNGDLIIYLQDCEDWWKVDHTTLTSTKIKNIGYPDPQNDEINSYSLNWDDFVVVAKGLDAGSAWATKINITTGVTTSLNTLRSGLGIHWVAANVKNDITYFVTTTGNTTGIWYRQFIYNESTNTITNCGYFNPNYIITEKNSNCVYLGNGKSMFFGSIFGSPSSNREVATYLFDAFTREMLTIPPRFLYDLKRVGTSMYTKPVCYDSDEEKLYVVNYDSTTSSNKFWGRAKTDFYNMPSSNSDIYNFPLDFTPILRMGLKVYLTLNTPCYQWTGDPGNYQVLRSERFEVTGRIVLKANFTNFSGTIEITQ